MAMVVEVVKVLMSTHYSLDGRVVVSDEEEMAMVKAGYSQ